MEASRSLPEIVAETLTILSGSVYRSTDPSIIAIASYPQSVVSNALWRLSQASEKKDIDRPVGYLAAICRKTLDHPTPRKPMDKSIDIKVLSPETALTLVMRDARWKVEACGREEAILWYRLLSEAMKLPYRQRMQWLVDARDSGPRAALAEGPPEMDLCEVMAFPEARK